MRIPLAAAVAAVLALGTSAKAASRYECNPPKGLVVHTIIEYDNSTWSVQHQTASRIIKRQDQYFMVDISDATRTGWSGILNSNPNINMIGKILTENTTGNLFYEESVYQNGVMIQRYLEPCIEIKKRVNTSPIYVPPPALRPAPPPPLPPVDSVKIYPTGNVVLIDVGLGSFAPVRMLLDTGAAQLTINDVMAEGLIEKGEASLIGTEQNTLADGSVVTSKMIRIQKVMIGKHELTDINAAVIPGNTIMLLGFPLLDQIGKFTIDSRNGELIFG